MEGEEDSVAGTFKFTYESLMEGYRYYAKTKARKPFRILLVLLGWLFLLFGGYELLSGSPVFDYLLFLILGSYLIFFRKLLFAWSIRRHFNKRPDKDIDIHLTVADSGVHSEYGSSRNDSAWDMFCKIYTTKDGFLFCPNDKMFYWIPVDAFSSEDDFRKAEEIIRRNVSEFIPIS